MDFVIFEALGAHRFESAKADIERDLAISISLLSQRGPEFAGVKCSPAVGAATALPCLAKMVW